MSLYVPLSSSLNWSYDNWGANPSATPGTSVTPGASNAEGSWTQVASSANIAQDVYGIYIKVSGGATSTAIKAQLLDIGVDPAGGTSYTAVISNLQIGASPLLTAAGNREYFFPFFIKSGSSVAVRIQGENGTAGTVRVAVKFWGRPSAPWRMPVGTFSATFGVDGTNPSRGTTVTPGNAADGSWTSFGTTSSELWWWQLSYNIANGTITAEYTYFDLAFGDGSNKHIIQRFMHVGTTGETCGHGMQPHMSWHRGYRRVPSGATLYVRARCNNAPDTAYNAIIVGIGG